MPTPPRRRGWNPRTRTRAGSTIDQMRQAELGPPPPPPPTRPEGHQKGVRYANGTRVGGWSHGRAGQQKVKTQVAMMAAAACAPKQIARGLLLSRERVQAILGQAETQGLVEDFRKIVRAHALSESLDIAVKGMAWVNEAIDNREAKEFDLVARGLSNMERVWSSAAGENKPQGVQVAVINQPGESPAAEIAKLLDMLVAPAQP